MSTETICDIGRCVKDFEPASAHGGRAATDCNGPQASTGADDS